MIKIDDIVVLYTKEQYGEIGIVNGKFKGGCTVDIDGITYCGILNSEVKVLGHMEPSEAVWEVHIMDEPNFDNYDAKGYTKELDFYYHISDVFVDVEISVLRSDNDYGKKSHGSGGQDKIVMFYGSTFKEPKNVSEAKKILEDCRAFAQICCDALNNAEFKFIE